MTPYVIPYIMWETTDELYNGLYNEPLYPYKELSEGYSSDEESTDEEYSSDEEYSTDEEITDDERYN